jgi:shikimate kinase
MTLLLAGFKGVGKTTCGQIIADLLERDFYDTDQILSHKFDMPIPALHQELCEEGFRQEEAKVLEELMEKRGCVIALGGGTLLSEKAQEIASEMGSLVYLHAELETLIDRLTPASFLDPRELVNSFKRIYLERHPIFCRLCQYRIDVDCKTPPEIAHTIVNFYA